MAATVVLLPPKSTFPRANAVGWTPMAVLVWRKLLDVAACRLPNENKEDCSALSVLSLSKVSTNALTGAVKEVSASNFLFRLSTKCSSRLFGHSVDASVIGDISESVKWIHLGGLKRWKDTRSLLRHRCTAKWWHQARKPWLKCCVCHVSVILKLALPEMVFGDVPARWPLLWWSATSCSSGSYSWEKDKRNMTDFWTLTVNNAWISDMNSFSSARSPGWCLARILTYHRLLKLWTFTPFLWCWTTCVGHRH